MKRSEFKRKRPLPKAFGLSSSREPDPSDKPRAWNSTLPARSAPLTRGEGFRREVLDASGTGKVLNDRASRRAPLKARSNKATSIPAEVRRAVKARANGLCEACGWPAEDVHLHHRKQISLGRDDTAVNLMAVHPICHVPGIHETVPKAKAEAMGWLVPSWGDPAKVPVLVSPDLFRVVLNLWGDE